MRDDEKNGIAPEDEAPLGGDDDLGPPISDLFDLEIETGDEFLSGVRKRIDRREMAAAAIDLSFINAGQVLWTYLEMLMETIFGSRNGPRNGKDS